MNIIFKSEEHKKFFSENINKCKIKDEYHNALFYVIGISDGARQNVNKLFDFREDVIKPEGLHDGWQTSGSVKACLLAFNLWNGYVDDEAGYTTPDNLFSCSYAQYFMEGIKLRYPSCFR